MKDIQSLTIIQYNVNHSKDKTQIHFLKEADLEIHHILAIQEPWINPHTSTPSSCKAANYYTCIRAKGNPRTMLYVSKALEENIWETKTYNDENGGGDITSIKITTQDQTYWIHNVYLAPPESKTSRELGVLEHLPGLLAIPGTHTVIGDFNIHHPTWGGPLVQPHTLSQSLISIIEQARMGLNTPQGTTTWHKGPSFSTIDLSWTTADQQDRIQFCGVEHKLDSDSDHLPLRTTITITVQREQPREPKLNWAMAD
jgi:exonuclease III